MDHSAKTHIGQVRDTNEDAFACAAERGLFVIADGMGGLDRGEVASRMAADQLLAGIVARLDPVFGPEEQDREQLLSDAIHRVQNQVDMENAADPAAGEMGTTAIALLLERDSLHYVHAGDSRIYVIGAAGTIEQVTKDQTVAQRMIDRGEDPAYATALHGHILTNFIGIGAPLDPKTGSRRIATGELVVMCTDGLSDMVTDGEIAAIVADDGADVDAIAQALIDRANENGGRDNVTVIVIRPGD